MKRKFTKLIAAFALLVFMTPSMVALGQTYTLVSQLNGLTNGTYCIAAFYNSKYYTVPNTTISGQTFTCTEATYSNSNNVLTPAEGHGQFVFTAVSGVENAYYIYNTNLNKYLVATGSKTFGYVENNSNDYGYWTFSNVSSGGFSGVFSIQHSSKTHYMRAYNNSVRCYDGASNNGVYIFVQNVSNDPSISASAVEIAYNATSGAIEYTINNPVSGGVLTATTTADWLSLGTVGTTVPFTCSANSGAERTAVVTLTYTYDSQTTTKDVTITQAADPNYVMTIAEARAQGTGEVTTKGVVTSIVGNTAYIQDATAAICVFGDSDHSITDLNVGDEIRVSGTLSLYKNLLEITLPTYTVLTTGNTVTPTVMTIAEINESTNQGWFIKIESATVGTTTSGNTTLTQGESSIFARNLSGATQGDVINLTGNISVYNTTKQIANPLVVVGPSITVDEDEISLTYQVGAAQAPQGTLIVEGSNLEGDVTVSLTQTGNFFQISEDGNTWGTADITLTPTGGTLEGSMIGVMLNTGLGLGTYSGTITLTTANVDPVTVTLTGTVTNQTYAINLTPPTTPGCTISADKATAEAGQTVTLTATPATGYAFGTWTVLDGEGDEVDVNNDQFTMPASDVEVEGSFSQINYTIILASTTNGMVECDDETALYGEEVLVTVTPDNGYRVQSFTVTETNGQGTVTDIEEAEGIYSFNMPAYNVTITVVFEVIPESYSGGSFTLHTGAIVEGYYIITYADNVMKNVVSSNRLANGTFPTITNNTINDPNGDLADIVWHIEADGTYWTIYNDAVEKYAAGTNTKNQCALIDEVTDLARWTATTSNNTYQFENLGRSQASSDNSNKWLRNNGSNGWACYASSIGGALTLYRLSPYINLEQYTFNFGHESEGGYYNIEYGNLNIQNASDFEVVYCDAEGNVLATQETPDMILTAAVVHRTGVANYELELTVKPNLTYEARTTYLRVKTTNTPAVYSDLVTVNQAAAPQPFNLTVSLGENVDAIFVYDDPNGDPLIEEGGEATIQVLSGTTIIVSPVAAPGYVISSLIVNNEEVISQLDPSGAYTFTMPASIVAITATAVVEPVIVTYTLATTIESGRHYIIVNEGSSKAMGGQNDNNRAAVDVEIEDGVATVSSTDVYEFVINGPDIITKNDQSVEVYTIYDASYVYNEETGGYLYAASGSKNHLKTETHLDTDNNALWTIAFDSENHAVITAQGTNSRNLMRYNSNNNIFSCYASGQDVIYLYVKDETTPQYDFYKDIAGYGTGSGKYYLITSPIDGADPEQVGMITDDNTNPENYSYDLYWFDQTQTEEWQNARQVESMSLVSGNLGYLYANKNNVTLHFTGTPNDVASVSLVKSDNDNVDWLGWNLVGNPLTVPAYIDRSFYRMNEGGTELIEGSGAISPMEGIFVIASENDEEMTFGTTAPDNAEPEVVVNVTNESKVIDRAVVRFSQGSQLPKFQLNANSTKLYMLQGDKEMAIVSAHAEGEMPVSFRAAENGTYTLTVNPEGVEMNYLHLIDNMTGTDVDLLATPSYTFEAKTSDYASRFRLVFSASSISEDADGDSAFAYFNGSSWTVSNMGEATLQVVDVMGRVLSSETLSGNAEVSINQTPGVYMLRLLNENNVRVQKIVVR